MTIARPLASSSSKSFTRLLTNRAGLRIRLQSTQSASQDLQRSGVSAGFTPLSSRSLIELRGPQASQFLQGLTTANIPSTTNEAPRAIYSAFLNAQGRLLQDVFIYPIPEDSKLLSRASDTGNTQDEQRFLIEVDTEQQTVLAKWLKRYQLRTKAAIREVSGEEIRIFSAWNDAADDGLKASISPHGSDSYLLPDTRAPNFGSRVLLPAGTDSHILQHTVGLPQDTEHSYKLRRYLFGIPEGQNELSYGSALVHDSGIDYMGGVDFRKGCYVGQELVIRTQHTGVVRKRVLPCMVYDSSDSPPSQPEVSSSAEDLTILNGADIIPVSEDGKKVRSKGKWLAGAGNVGLALCRLEDMVGIGPAGDIVDGWEEKQWTFQWEGQSEEAKRLRVKAFVPSWWRDRAQKVKISEHGVAV